MILAVLGIAILLLLGYFVASLLWPAAAPRQLVPVFAPAVGAGVCSMIFVAFRRPMFTAEAVLLFASGAAWLYRRSRRGSLISLSAWRPPAICLLLACALGMALSYWFIRIERTPHGDWDAMAIWNSHARYLYRDGPSWQKGIVNTFHPDYPLLAPSLTARLWRYMGREIPDAAGLMGLLFTVSALAILVGVLAQLRSARHAVLFGLVLLGTPFYVDYSVSESADIPLSLFMLATIALICIQAMASREHGLLILAGFMAGCAGWTKNEGLLFISATSVALLLTSVTNPRETLRTFAAFCAGLALPLGVIIWFKLAVAPPNDIFNRARQFQEILQKLMNPERYVVTLENLANAFWSFGDWFVNPVLLLALFVALQGIDREMIRNRTWLQSCFICVAVLVGYFTVYIISPINLEWHLGSSAS